MEKKAANEILGPIIAFCVSYANSEKAALIETNRTYYIGKQMACSEIAMALVGPEHYNIFVDGTLRPCTQA